jgi:hypothetical protein
MVTWELRAFLEPFLALFSPFLVVTAVIIIVIVRS